MHFTTLYRERYPLTCTLSIPAFPNLAFHFLFLVIQALGGHITPWFLVSGETRDRSDRISGSSDGTKLKRCRSLVLCSYWNLRFFLPTGLSSGGIDSRLAVAVDILVVSLPIYLGTDTGTVIALAAVCCSSRRRRAQESKAVNLAQKKNRQQID